MILRLARWRVYCASQAEKLGRPELCEDLEDAALGVLEPDGERRLVKNKPKISPPAQRRRRCPRHRCLRARSEDSTQRSMPGVS